MLVLQSIAGSSLLPIRATFPMTCVGIRFNVLPNYCSRLLCPPDDLYVSVLPVQIEVILLL